MAFLIDLFRIRRIHIRFLRGFVAVDRILLSISFTAKIHVYGFIMNYLHWQNSVKYAGTGIYLIRRARKQTSRRHLRLSAPPFSWEGEVTVERAEETVVFVVLVINCCAGRNFLILEPEQR